jgi:ribosomal protein L11 methyltransferase
LADDGPRLWPAVDVDAGLWHPLPADFEDRLAVLVDGHDVAAIEEQAGTAWRIYFFSTEARDAALEALRGALEDVAALSPVEVADEGWAVKVQSALGPVTVEDMVVTPPWALSQVAPGSRLVIEIEPSTGFGTGHHQSTRLCLRALRELPLRDARVVDIGTGSGVLGIAAALLGASHVLAIDHDPDAIASARDNARRNRLGPSFEAVAIDIADLPPQRADVVFANLTANLLRRSATAIARLLAPGAALVVSGFTAGQVSLVTDAFPELHVAARLEEDDWVALRLVKQAGFGPAEGAA